VHDLQAQNGQMRFHVDPGALEAALRELTSAGVRSLVSQPPTLEELFLRHYDRTGAAANRSGAEQSEVAR